MPLLVQHLVVLTLVAACLGYVGWQAARTLYGKKSRLGSCCAKGCATTKSTVPAPNRIVFLPVEMLRRKRS
jgi:hypothetical protein